MLNRLNWSFAINRRHQRPRTGDPNCRRHFCGALAPRDWASRPQCHLLSVPVCSLRGSVSVDVPHDREMHRRAIAASSGPWSGAAEGKPWQPQTSVNQHQRLHPGRFGPRGEAQICLTRTRQGLFVTFLPPARPSLAAFCDHERQTAIRTGLGHLDSVLDHWYQSPGPATAPSQGTSHQRRLRSSVTASTHALPRFAERLDKEEGGTL
jgi:hypothetical protein